VKYILYPFQWLWRAWFSINAVITFFIFFPFFFVLLSSRKWFPIVFRLKKIWARFLMFPAGLFYSIERNSMPDKKRSYVFCPNHTSYLDIILIYVSIPNYFHTVGKAELKKVPLFSKFFSRMNIPVNRNSLRDSHRAFTRAAEDLDKGISVTLFPEGRINHTAPVMGRFKNGPFRLAIEKQVPVVPITFLNNWDLLPDRYTGPVGHPGIAHVIFHPPIETSGMTQNDLETLKQKVYEVINQPIKEKYPQYFESAEGTMPLQDSVLIQK
jgi:1-acyl-sn-glycerol-3-phosphate acyltransferase